MKLFNIILVLLCLQSLVSCNRLWEMKRKIRTTLFGESNDDILEDEEEYEEEEEQIQASPRIDKITPQSKLFNLMREYTTSGDETFVNIIIKEIPLVASDFSGPYNETLVSSMQKFAPLIEARKKNAMKIMAQWYKSLNGKNKTEAGRILALNLDYNAVAFFKEYKILLQNDGCRLSLMLPPRIQGNSKSIEYLSARKDRLKSLLEDESLQGFSGTVAQQCVSLMRERITLFKNSKTGLQ